MLCIVHVAVVTNYSGKSAGIHITVCRKKFSQILLNFGVNSGRRESEACTLITITQCDVMKCSVTCAWSGIAYHALYLLACSLYIKPASSGLRTATVRHLPGRLGCVIPKSCPDHCLCCALCRVTAESQEVLGQRYGLLIIGAGAGTSTTDHTYLY